LLQLPRGHILSQLELIEESAHILNCPIPQGQASDGNSELMDPIDVPFYVLLWDPGLEDNMWVDLADGRQLGVPLVYFPRLLHASQVQRESFIISPGGIHWDDIDEDISISGLLAGIGDRMRKAS
jgi:hypothetical protein